MFVQRLLSCRPHVCKNRESVSNLPLSPIPTGTLRIKPAGKSDRTVRRRLYRKVESVFFRKLATPARLLCNLPSDSAPDGLEVSSLDDQTQRAFRIRGQSPQRFRQYLWWQQCGAQSWLWSVGQHTSSENSQTETTMVRNKRSQAAASGKNNAGPRKRSTAVRKSPRPRPVPDARGARPRRVHRADSVTAEEVAVDGAVRLQKFLANAGVDSRRNCEEYIRTGRVTVNDEVVTDPARGVQPETDEIRLDAEKLQMPRLRYFLLNKPAGVLCTNRDPQGRPRAVDLIPVNEERLFTVGRLDENTRGLLLLTNDGQLAQRMAHPRFEVVRRYRCHVAGRPDAEILRQLREGMYFSDGFFRFRGVRVVRFQGRSSVLELELKEGRNREIRRLMARVGHKVIELERIAFGPITLGRLTPGEFRELRPAEISALKQFLQTGRMPDSVRRGSASQRPKSSGRRRPAIGSRGQNGPKRGAARPGRNRSPGNASSAKTRRKSSGPRR